VLANAIFRTDVGHEDSLACTAVKIFRREGSTPRKPAEPPSMTIAPSTRILNSP
jgi:hypothetical protein